MRTLRFGRKLKLPTTVAIKHQIRTLMAEDEIKKVQAEASFDQTSPHPQLMIAS